MNAHPYSREVSCFPARHATRKRSVARALDTGRHKEAEPLYETERIYKDVEMQSSGREVPAMGETTVPASGAVMENPNSFDTAKVPLHEASESPSLGSMKSWAPLLAVTTWTPMNNYKAETETDPVASGAVISSSLPLSWNSDLF